jgi:hypothetical protein
MKLLTKQLLREAADRTGSVVEGYRFNDQTFMCHTIYAVAKERVDADHGLECEKAFRVLLKEHHVTTCGNLGFKPCGNRSYVESADCSSEEKQELRFMFLNFLAEAA